ncbi:hypothetical protein [Nostoc commune]|uniref:hypothetical protein n=1 Tax=Nostoc commune TaxID=1178 RepID=UPI0018C6AD01|nr:hypothetical protein [Nostoc commune]MBG1258412.1 hypothetical protein [Nostoc commune BAE]
MLDISSRITEVEESKRYLSWDLYNYITLFQAYVLEVKIKDGGELRSYLSSNTYEFTFYVSLNQSTEVIKNSKFAHYLKPFIKFEIDIENNTRKFATGIRYCLEGNIAYQMASAWGYFDPKSNLKIIWNPIKPQEFVIEYNIEEKKDGENVKENIYLLLPLKLINYLEDYIKIPVGVNLKVKAAISRTYEVSVPMFSMGLLDLELQQSYAMNFLEETAIEVRLPGFYQTPDIEESLSFGEKIENMIERIPNIFITLDNIKENIIDVISNIGMNKRM